MAFEVEAWWSANYNKFSIRDMQRLPIFHRFLQLHYPFEHSDDIVHEKFWVEDNEVDIFEWTDKAAKKTERFFHNRKLRQYHYQVSYSDLESPIVIKSWFQQDLEWGTIVRDYGDFQVHEGWRLEPPTRIYERFTTERGIRKGFRAGIHPYKGEYERWVEEIWEIEDESVFSKQWYKEGESGGETTNRKGEYTWGENWYSSAKRDEKKCWHKDGIHEWGHDHGTEAPKHWDHSWDVNAEDKYEEKVSVTNGRDTGYRFWGKQKDWYKQEWEGLHLLERDDRSEQVVSAKFRSRLDNVYVNEYNGTLKQQQTLRILLAYLPAYAAKVQALEKTREEIHVKDRESIEELFDGIDGLRGVQDDQEKLTQEMIGEFREEANTISAYNAFFLASFNNSLKTLKQIGDVIKDDSAHNDYIPKVAEWRDTLRPSVAKGKAALLLLEQIEVTKQEELLKFRGGIPQEEVQKAMNTLYQIMVKHDAVSDKIVELTHAEDFKLKLDGMEDKFEEIHKNFLEEGDPNKLHEMLGLLLDYQPIHLHLVGRIRGFNKDETESEIGRIDSAVSETKGAPSLKNTRAKVRSGKVTRDTPFQVMDRNFSLFIPLFQKLLAAVDAPKAGFEALEAVSKKSVNSTEPVEVLVEKSQVLVDVIRGADPSVDAHDQELRTTDENVNLFFTDVFPVFAALPDGEETLVAPRRLLVEKSKETGYFPPLLLAKSEALRQQTPIVKEHAEKSKSQASQLSESLLKFIPYFIHHLKTVNAPAETIEALKTAAEKVPDRWQPLVTLNEQAEALLTQAQVAEPSIHRHDEALKKTDENVNQFFTEIFPVFAALPDGEETLVAPRRLLVEKSKETEYFPPLLLTKSEALIQQAPIVKEHAEKSKNQASQLSESLQKFIPYFIHHLKTVNAPAETIEALKTAAEKVPDRWQPLVTLNEQADALLTQAQAAEPSIHTHDETLKQTDENLNKAFIGAFPAYATVPEGEEKLIKPREVLIEKSKETEYFPPLILLKSELARDEVPIVITHLGRAGSKVPSLVTNLGKFIPFFIAHLKTVNAPVEAAEALTAEAAKVPDKYYPLEVLDEQVEALLKHAEEAVSSVEEHNQSIKTSDDNLNRYFQETFPLYENIEGAEEAIVEPRNALISESETTEYFPPLVQRKTEELLGHTSEVPDYINALVGEIQTLQEETTTTTTIVEDLQTTLSQKSELIDQLQRKIKELEKRLGLINDDLTEARKYKPLYEERDVAATRLGNEVKELSIKASDLSLHLDHANSENAGLKTQVEELTAFRLRALDLEQENAKLQGIIKSYDSVFGDKKAQFEHIISSLNNEISSRDGKIKELLDRIKVLEAEIGVKDNDRKKQLMLRIISGLANTLKVERSSTFLLWKYTSLGPEDIPPESILDKVPETAGFKDESVDANELQSFTVTEPPLVEERKLQISTNIIAKHWRLSGIKFDKPAKAFETLRFWDQLLDKKAEADQADLAANKKPLLLSEFTLDHLLRTLNNRRIAQEQLGSHLPALYRLYADGHQYAVLISRLLHLFNASPAPLEAQVLVVEYRKQFEQLAQAYSDSRTARNLAVKPDLDIASTGGEAPLRAVLAKFYHSIAAPQFIPEHWIRNLKPSNVSLLDYVVFLVYLQLETQAKTPESFWTAADAGNAGKTEGDAFAHAVQATGIHISTRLLREATATPLTKEDFFAKKPTDLDDDKYLVSLAGFLTGILEAYLAKVRRATVEYTKLFESAGNPHVNKAAFIELAHTLQADVPTEVLEKFYDEGLTLSSTQEGLDSGAFIRVLLRHFLGSYSHPPLAIEQLHLLTDLHVTEYNLETGIKTVVTTTKTTKVITTTKKVVTSKKA